MAPPHLLPSLLCIHVRAPLDVIERAMNDRAVHGKWLPVPKTNLQASVIFRINAVFHCFAVWCGVVWCGVVWCGVVWCGVCMCSTGIEVKTSYGGPSSRFDDGAYGLAQYEEDSVWGVRLSAGYSDSPEALVKALERFLDALSCQ
jgi:hypothetical protein